LELATEELFEDIRGRGVKGPYRWQRQLEALRTAKTLFPDVLTHLMIGLGETEREAVECIGMVQRMGIRTSIFPFLPLPGTALYDNPRRSGRPSRASWRRVQVARYLINEGNLDPDAVLYEDDRIVGFDMPQEEFMSLMESGKPFMSSGCKYCSRPGYAEDPKTAGEDTQQWHAEEPYVYQLTPFPGTIRRLVQQLDLRVPVAN
jgi:biotin synthase